MQAASVRGVKFGRPYGIPIEEQPGMLALWYSGNFTKTELARQYNVHISSIKRAIRRDVEQRQPVLQLQ